MDKEEVFWICVFSFVGYFFLIAAIAFALLRF